MASTKTVLSMQVMAESCLEMIYFTCCCWRSVADAMAHAQVDSHISRDVGSKYVVGN